MASRRTQRSLALFALALVLLAALPCSMLAGEAACCGMSSHCSDANAAPCAQLAAAPCCKAPEAPPVAASFTPHVPAFDYYDVQDRFSPEPLFCEEMISRASAAPLRDSISIRTIVLRL